MFFPIGDDNVKGGHTPIFSYLFLAINILVFLYQVSMPPDMQDNFVFDFGSIPLKIMHGEGYWTIFSSMFMHGGWMHLIGNMMFLWVFADNIEAVIGNIPFAIFYILGGVAASLAHILASPYSEIPCVGASGAIAAVLGAYLVMFPGSRIRVLFMLFFSTFHVPAIYFLGFWIIQQLGNGIMTINAETEGTSGVAWWAHIGGFAFGILAGFYFRKKYHTTEYV